MFPVEAVTLGLVVAAFTAIRCCELLSSFPAIATVNVGDHGQVRGAGVARQVLVNCREGLPRAIVADLRLNLDEVLELRSQNIVGCAGVNISIVCIGHQLGITLYEGFKVHFTG